MDGRGGKIISPQLVKWRMLYYACVQKEQNNGRFGNMLVCVVRWGGGLSMGRIALIMEGVFFRILWSHARVKLLSLSFALQME